MGTKVEVFTPAGNKDAWKLLKADLPTPNRGASPALGWAWPRRSPLAPTGAELGAESESQPSLTGGAQHGEAG